MKRIIKGSFSRLFAATKAFLLVFSCFMVSNLWTMEGDGTAKLINKTGVGLTISVQFPKGVKLNLREPDNYSIEGGATKSIRVKRGGKVGAVKIYIHENGYDYANGYWGTVKTSGNTAFNVGYFPADILPGKTYEITAETRIVPVLKKIE